MSDAVAVCQIFETWGGFLERGLDEAMQCLFATSVMLACIFDMGESHATHARGCAGSEFCEGGVKVSHEEGDIDVGGGSWRGGSWGWWLQRVSRLDPTAGTIVAPSMSPLALEVQPRLTGVWILPAFCCVVRVLEGQGLLVFKGLQAVCAVLWHALRRSWVWEV